MQEYVTLSIDGAKVRAPRGTTVLDAALKMGLCIPHLCHMPGFTGLGACRLCLVELVQGERRRVTTSCTLLVQEGMVVEATTEKIQRLRRNVAEMLVAEAPNSKAIQDIAVRCGVTEVRYPFRQKDCVLCGRCVRVCTEMWQARAIGFVGRGKARHVDFPFGTRPDFCKMCKSCIDLCPMITPPCGGLMEEGEEQLCGKCQSQLRLAEQMPGYCIRCELGENFQCTRAGA